MKVVLDEDRTLDDIEVKISAPYIDERVIRIVVSMLLASSFPFLQMVWFKDCTIKKMGYFPRILGFGACYYVVLLFAACMGSWMPFNASTLLVFTGIFLAILVALSVVYHLHFKRVAGSYQAALERYHQGER